MLAFEIEETKKSTGGEDKIKGTGRRKNTFLTLKMRLQLSKDILSNINKENDSTEDGTLICS